jgi:sugar lactone lactonase YvrE
MRLQRAILACTCLATAACADQRVTGPADAPSITRAEQAFPARIALPDAFSPEGIAFGRGSTFYVGSIPTGAIFRGDAAAGAGAVLVAPQAGRQASGIKVDQRERLFVAGGLTGQAYVYDGATGATLAVYQLAAPGTALINDVVLTRDAAYFTDSFNPVLYVVPLAPNGTLAPAGAVRVLPLVGDFAQVPGQISGNGIAATPSGGELVLVNSATGLLYHVDPATGRTTTIDLGGATVPGGDGIVLDGRDVYVVQGGVPGRITVVRLSPDLRSGVVARTITSPAFRFPSTAAEFGGSLYVVNARFDAAPPPFPAPGVEFEVVRVAKR